MYTVNVLDKDYQISINKNEKNKLIVDGKEVVLDILSSKKDSLHLLYNNKSYNIEIVDIDRDSNIVKLNINGVNYSSTVNSEIDLMLKKLGLDKLATKKINEVKAPMPGMVLDVLVDVGQQVNVGDTILILEAMKMENNIKSPTTGKVIEIKVNKGNAVEKNQILVVFE
jgi:biotin carboxyl carrier protein